MSPLLIGEILGESVNTFTGGAKYSVQDCQNFSLPIQMKLSEKRKKFLNFLIHFQKIHQILNFLKKKMMVIANVFPKLQTVKNLVRPLSKKHRFRTRFDSQHVKSSQIFAKSP